MRRAAILSGPVLAVLLSLSACGGSGPARSASTSSGPSAVTSSPVATAAPPSSTGPSSPPTTPASTTASSTTASRPRSSTAAPRPSSAPPRTSARPSAPPAVPHGLTVVLNPGHNGGNASHPGEINRQVPAGYGDHKACDTTGTETNAGYSEHAFNFSVGQDVAAILRAHGVSVLFTRPDDTGVGPCVDRRAAIGNHSFVAAVVSIHADGAPSSGHGFHVNQASRRPDGATAAVASASDRLGEDIHAALVRSSGLVPSTYIGKNGYFYRSDLAGLNLATRPATFLELGNMRNSGDAALQTSASGRERIATAVADGILAFLGR